MLLRLQPCAVSLVLVLLVQTTLGLLGLVLVEAVPATRAPGGGRRRSTTTAATPSPPICVDTTTTSTAATPTTSLAATNSTWPRVWLGPDATPPSVIQPPGVGVGGSDRDNMVEDEDSVTCYTCVNVSDNIICNKYAIDVPCPKGEDFCHTLHIVDSRGHSVLVNKKCAEASECDPGVLGCLHIDTQTVCASCCDESYCNETVPTNRTAAFYKSTRARPSTPPSTGRSGSRAAGRAAAAAVHVASGLASVWLSAACLRGSC